MKRMRDVKTRQGNKASQRRGKKRGGVGGRGEYRVGGWLRWEKFA